MTTTPLVELRGVVKEYRALRPLRIEELTVGEGDIVSLDGLDAGAAEMLVTLVTGASLPDRGEVRLFGRSTATIDDSDAWLRLLDGVGMISRRVVLLDQYTVRQNVAMSFTLDLEPVPADVLARVDTLAEEAGIGRADLDALAGRVTPDVRMRVRLARALALGPQLLLGEHPTADMAPPAAGPFAADLLQVARARRTGLLVITADDRLARGLGGTRLTLEPSTGRWRSGGLWKRMTGGLKPTTRP
jgi:predicted ABC-type transport system involved in lysophospholipase L1 biosynthesis ATPase subunit